VFCPTCRDEYVEGVVSCAGCGAALVATLPPKASKQAPDIDAPICVGSYSLPQEADVARTILESEGIECFIENENTIKANWLWSNAIGGVRILVAQPHAEEARALLDVRVPGEPPELQPDQAYEEDDGTACPKCGSQDLNYRRFSKRAVALTILLLGLPFPFLRRRYRCNKCGEEWPAE